MPSPKKRAKKPSKSRAVVAEMMKETHTHEPSTVKRANVSPARKEAMRKAIAFSKARKAGAKVPKKPARDKATKARKRSDHEFI